MATETKKKEQEQWPIWCGKDQELKLIAIRHKDDGKADSSSFTAAEYLSKKYSAAKEFRVSNIFHRESDHGLFAPS